MGKTQEETPPTWSDFPASNVKDAGRGIYYSILDGGVVKGGNASNVWVYHWHTPIRKGQKASLSEDQRWFISACSLHTVLQVEPLTLDPSLACVDGCDNHGWIKDGIWNPA